MFPVWPKLIICAKWPALLSSIVMDYVTTRGTIVLDREMMNEFDSFGSTWISLSALSFLRRTPRQKTCPNGQLKVQRKWVTWAMAFFLVHCYNNRARTQHRLKWRSKWPVPTDDITIRQDPDRIGIFTVTASTSCSAVPSNMENNQYYSRKIYRIDRSLVPLRVKIGIFQTVTFLKPWHRLWPQLCCATTLEGGDSTRGNHLMGPGELDNSKQLF